uniref:Protein LURP-one-related 8 n=1 Tax=Oryza brachyantha TaxID=4533 RepID=J3M5W3_ORYBR
MTKVHPGVAAGAAAAAAVEEGKGEAVSLTVWRRSLLFNGKGFTVFDGAGNLVFRVESYAGGSSREVVLMDADGRALLTIRRKKLSLADEWLIYDGDAAKEAAVGPDVFRLGVEPGFEPALAMAVVILLDQMHAS